jgi:hypothetical protein
LSNNAGSGSGSVINQSGSTTLINLIDFLVQVVSLSTAEDVLLTWEEERSQRFLGELARNTMQLHI